MRNIAIIGATGMLGQPVTHEFIKAGFEVSILARDINKAGQVFGTSVQVVHGNIKDPGTIRQLLNGKDGLYMNLSVEQKSRNVDFQPEREGLDNILKISKETGIKRIGYLSSLVQFYQGKNGFNWWVFNIKQAAIEKIKKSGTAYSIFYPSTFMESFDKGAYRQGNSIVLSGISKHKMFLISGNDYGKQVVKAFQLNHGNNDFIVQGPEGYTADEAAKFYIENSEKTVTILKAPFFVLKFLGFFTNKFNYAAHIVEALNNYPEKFEAEETWKTLGKPQMKFIDYIKKSQQTKHIDFNT